MLKRILITLAIIACSQLILQLTLPGVDKDALESAGRRQTFNVMALGLRPMIVAFTFVELGSFLFPGGRRLRRSGTDGRRRLNMFSMSLGVILAAIQASGIAYALERQGYSVLPALPFLLLSILTMVAGTLVALLLASIVSRWGMCNGISLMICLPILWWSVPQIYRAATAPYKVFASNFEPLLWMATVAVLVWVFARRPEVELISNRQNRVLAAAPALPQGAEPIALAMGIFSVAAFFDEAWQFAGPDTIWLSAAALLASCFLTFHLFSSRKRLFANLPAGTVSESTERPLRNRMLATALALASLLVLNSFGESLLNFRLTEIPGLLGLIILVAFGFDFAAEIRFRLRHGDDIASVIEMDNVYGASYLRAILAEAGIDSMARAFHYRSLFFFLEPIVKIELLVPADKVSQAQGLIQSAALEIV